MRKLIFPFVCLLLALPCAADTFTEHRTGDTFNGYATQRRKGNKTQVYIEKKGSQYLALSDYDIRYNYLGRRNKIFVFSINKPIDLICETEAFEKSIEVASNQGPLFILIQVDTPGGHVDLMKRFCAAINKIDNCMTVAFIDGGQSSDRQRKRGDTADPYGGAFSAGAIIALACDKIFMLEETAIGAAATVVTSPSGTQDLSIALGETVAAKIVSVDRAYVATLAERHGRPPLLAKAMVDKNTQVVEVLRNGQSVFTDPESKRNGDLEVETWSTKDSLLALTAKEALRCGIADGVVRSAKELFSVFQASNAARVQDKDIPQARSTFEIVQTKFKKSLASIERLQSQAQATSNLQQLVTINKALAKKYKKALILAKNHPDLERYVNPLEEALKRYK